MVDGFQELRRNDKPRKVSQVLVGEGVSGSLHGPVVLLAGERLLWAGHFRWPTHFRLFRLNL